MAPSAIVLLSLLALASAAPQHESLSRSRRGTEIVTIMPEICTLSQGQGNKQVASLVAQAIELFRILPENSVVEVLDKIRAGEFCADYSKLESLFLDAVAFVGEPGAVKVMAQEIAAGRTTGGRLGLYTVALNLLTKPSLDHVSALTPIFRMENSNQLVSLAASTVVNRYCTQNWNAECAEDEPVLKIKNLLQTKLQKQCTPAFSKQDTLQVLTTLKSVGNIGLGYTDQDLFENVMRCALTEGIETNVRFAAVMSLRGVSCNDDQWIESFIATALDVSINTEVRIGSYLAAIRCKRAEDLEMYKKAMEYETNNQVKGFILSHLENLQETNWPPKQSHREILVSTNDAKVYRSNIFKYSRNIELSANSPVLNVGGLVESNIVYTPESYVPRLVNLGLNVNLLGSFIDIGEVGARVEGLDQYIEDILGPNSYLYKEVFGPNSYLYNQPLGSIIEDSKIFMTDKGTEILQQIQQLVKENNINLDYIIKAVNRIIKNSKNINAEMILKAFNEVLKNAENIDINSALKMVDFDSILKYILNYLNNNKFILPKTDLYAIVRAQERAFLSFGGEKHQFTIDQLIKYVVPIIMNALSSAQDINVDTARMGQFNIDYSLPAINGMPLRLRLKGTGVAGIQLRNNLNVKSGAVDALVKIIPSFNGQIEGQISFGDSEGIKLKGNVYSTNGFALNVVRKGEDLELQVDLPEKMELLNIEIETDKASTEDIRIKSNQCSGIIESVTGLLVCYEMNVTDLKKNYLLGNELPLGKPLMFRIYFEKSDTALKGYRLAAKFKNKPTKKMINIAAGTYGSADSKESTLTLSYTKREDTYLVATKFQSSLFESKNVLTFINQPEYKSLQYYCSDEIGTGISVEGSVKIDFKALAVSNGNTFEVAVYAGLRKVLNEKNRLFQVLFSLLENGDKTAATFLTKTDLLPVTFEAGIELPSNAGLRIYKVESITLRSTLSSVEVEALFIKKSSEVYESILNIKRSGSALATFSAVNTISIESRLTGFEAFKLKLMTKTKAKFPMMELGYTAKLTYKNGVMDTFSGVEYNESGFVAVKSSLSYTDKGIEMTTTASYLSAMVLDASIVHNLDIWNAPVMKIKIAVPKVFLLAIYHEIDSTGITTVTEVKVPGVIKPLQVNSVLVITDVFTYSFLIEVESGDEVVLHAEGPLTYTFSTLLVQQKLDVQISGAFDGTFNVKQEFTLALEKTQFIFNVETKNTPIVLVDLVLELTTPEEFSGIGKLNIPFVIDSVQTAIITTSEEYIHLYLDTNNLVLPRTEYAHKFMCNVEFTLMENEFKSGHNWDITKWVENMSNDRIVGTTAKYTLKWPTFEFLSDGQLWALNLHYAYTLESVLASPLEWFQGNSGLEIIIREYTSGIPHDVAVIKNKVDIQYTDSQVSLTPLFVILTDFDNNFEMDKQFELTSSVVAKRLPAFLNFDVAYEATLSTPQLQKITLASKLLHEDKDESGKLLFRVSLKESVLNEECSFTYIMVSKPALLNRRIKMQYGTLIVKLNTDIVPPRYTVGLFGLLPINTGDPFGITYELNLPLENVKSLKVKLSADNGLIELAFLKNEKKMVKIYYSKATPVYFASLFANHILGIETNKRTIEFRSELEQNQLSFKIFPEINKGDKALEAYLRVTPKASAVQFEALVTSPSLTKEMRFSVEMELIENGKDKSDQISIDVQYQFSGTLKLLKVTLTELQSIYVDFVSDGLLPNLNELYEISQKMMKQVTEIIDNIYGNIIYQLTVTIPSELILLWEKIQSDVPMYWEMIKTEAPAFFTNYMEVIKNTETWNAVQTTLKEIMVNYPAFYDYIEEFYNKVIIKYITDLSESVSRLLVLSRSDFQIYSELFKTEIPEYIKNFFKRILETKIVKDLKAAFPTVFEVVVDFYSKIILPTYDDVDTIVLELTSIPITDVQESIQQYWIVLKIKVPKLFNNFVQRLAATQLVTELKSLLPTVFEVSEDFYKLVLLPTAEDVRAFVEQLAAVPVSGINKAVNKYWKIIQVEIPNLMTKFIQRIPNTQVINLLQTNIAKLSSMVQNKFEELKAQYPEVYAVGLDFYTKVVVPVIDDVPTLYNKIIGITDQNQLRDFLTTDILMFVRNLITNISTTDIFNKIMAVLDQVAAGYPDEYSAIITFYKDIKELTVSDVVSAIDSLFAKFAMSFSISAEKFTAVIPLPVTIEILRNSQQLILDFMESSVDLPFLIFQYSSHLGHQVVEYIVFQLPYYRNYFQYVVLSVQELTVTIPQLVFDILAKIPEDDDEFFENLEEMIENFLSTPYGKLTEQIVEKLFELLMTSYSELAELYPKEILALNDFLIGCVEELEDFAEFAIHRIIKIMVLSEIYQDFYKEAFEEFLEPVISGIVEHPLAQKIINYISTLTIEKAQFDMSYLFMFVMETIEELGEALPTEVIASINQHVPKFVFEYVNLGFFVFFVFLVIGM